MKSPGRELAVFLQEYPVRPFNWGTHNCGHFAHDWYVFFCQKECVRSWPQFARQSDVRRFFRNMNGSMEVLVTEVSGLQRIKPQYAATGDIVLFTMPDRDLMALGICNGSTSVFLDMDGSPQFAPVHCSAVWKLPNVA